MTDNQNQINNLLLKLEMLLEKHDDFTKEIYHLKNEIEFLKNNIGQKTEQQNIEDPKDSVELHEFVEEFQEFEKSPEEPNISQTSYHKPKAKRSPLIKLDLEKFIGENLINKIGILITLIGVVIGAKYSIEHELISPLTRIILGYMVGFSLLAFGIKLKTKYESYSAVLVSGSIAIVYFITYSAYSLYGLIPQIPAFGLMVVFTAFAVISAINYNRSIIAHIGLVGAYAVPFLLSEGSEKVAVLFSYMAIINIGILIIAFKKYWKNLYYVSFGFTWLMYISWYVSEFDSNVQYGLALAFLLIFFIIFYLTFLSYKLIQKEKYNIGDIILLMLNSFIFYALGYSLLQDHETGKQLLGLFTLSNAIIHFMVSAVIYKQKLADKNLLYLISGLVLIFITLTIPVQLDGNWVTILWAGEAALLFWIGRTKKVSIYEKLSYPLMALAFFSIFHDWISVYEVYDYDDSGTGIRPILNVNFLTSLLFIAAFVFINLLNRNKNYVSILDPTKKYSRIIAFSISAILIIVTYYALRMEISSYWDQLISASRINVNNENYSSSIVNNDLRSFKTLWLINYSLLFVVVLEILNMKKIKNKQLGLIAFGFIAFVICIFLIDGLIVLSELRESYLNQSQGEYYKIGTYNMIIRYISFVFVSLALFTSLKYIKKGIIDQKIIIGFDLFIHIAILWIASSELIHWMDIGEFSQSYKLGLSILWGIYALFLIILGIWKNRMYLRIASFVLFGIILLKLFFYDISHMDTIAKTIVFICLGTLLLIISFLYNKFKDKITDENNH